MYKGKFAILMAVVVIASMVMAACAPAPAAPAEPVVITQVVEVEKTVVKEVQVTAEAPAAASFDVSPRPDTLTIVETDDAASLDPHLAYEGTSYDIIENILEPLIAFNKTSASEYIPQLSTNVPSTADGTISEDGKTYTFNIRPGVKFENGNDLTASDAAYSYQRVLLQSDPGSGAWMMLEAIMGYDEVVANLEDGKYSGDPAALKAGAKAEDLVKVCEDVKSHFEADDAAGTFKVTLAEPWGPFLAIIARPWAFIIDKEWAAEQGDWDGSCETWQDFYAPGQEGTKLGKVIMGTGPYKLDHWTPDQEWVLTAKEDYWRTEPMWEGGPSGAPKIKTVVHKTVPEWGTRFAMLQTGDADVVDVPVANYAQADSLVGEDCDVVTNECATSATPDQPLRVFKKLENLGRTDIFLNQGIKTGEGGTNPYIGSGVLDGNGVPPDFFSDIHMRKAIAYCFDYDTYIEEAQSGEGIRNTSFLIINTLGYDPNQETYNFDMDKCKEELELAWDGKVGEVGFRVQGITATGYTMNQTALAILQANLRAVDPKYKLEIVTLPWASYLAAFRATQLPIAVSGWSEDYHDPHNWAQPFLIGTYATRSGFSEEFKEIFAPLINEAVREPDPAKREALYHQLNALNFEYVPEINLSQITSRHYEQRWLKNFYWNPVQGYRYFYALDIAGNK